MQRDAGPPPGSYGIRAMYSTLHWAFVDALLRGAAGPDGLRSMFSEPEIGQLVLLVNGYVPAA